MATDGPTSRLSKSGDICSIAGLLVAIVIGVTQIVLWVKNGDIGFDAMKAAFAVLVLSMLAAGVLHFRAARLRQATAPDVLTATARTRSASNPLPQVDLAIWDDVSRLSWFQSFALRYLLFADQTNGARFSDRMANEWGFPVLTLQQQNEIVAVFDQINERTSLLRKDPDSQLWSIRNKDQVRAALARVPQLPWQV